MSDNSIISTGDFALTAINRNGKAGATRLGVAAVHIILPLLLTVCVAVATMYKIYSFDVTDFDFGLFSNIIWNFANDNGWFSSFYIGQVRSNFLADHVSFYIPLLAPLIKMYPSPYTLGIIHAFFFSLSYFLIPVLVREIWKSAGRRDYLLPALFLLCVFVTFKGSGAAWRYMTHMTTLATPFVLCALIALHRKSLGWAAFWCLVVIMAQERAAVAVFGIGMYAILITGNTRFGFLVCACSTMYFFTVVKLVIPSFYAPGGEYLYNRLIAPLFELPQKGAFVFNFFLYWFFMPFMGKRAFFAVLCAMPLIALSLVSCRPTMYHFANQYQDLPSIFFLAASVHGIFWLTARPRFASLPKWGVAGLALVCLIFSYKYARHTIPLQYVTRLNFPTAVSRQHADIAKYAANIPEEIHVFASGGVGPWLSFRKYRRSFVGHSPKRPFSNSLVYVGRVGSVHPFDSFDKLVSLLDANPSLNLVKDTGTLRIYASNDLQFVPGQ